MFFGQFSDVFLILPQRAKLVTLHIMAQTRKKVLIITGPLNGGGAERVLVDVLRHWDRRCADVDLLQIVGGGILVPQVPRWVRRLCAWPDYCREFSIAYNLSRKLHIHAPLRRRIIDACGGSLGGYDAVVSFLEGLPLLCHALVAPKDAVNATWIHSDIYTAPYERAQFGCERRERRAYAAMDAVVGVSNGVVDAFRRRFPMLGDAPLYTVYNPVDAVSICEQAATTPLEGDGGHREGVFDIVAVGRLTGQKRFDRLVRLAAALPGRTSRKFHITIIGDGELRDDMRRQIDEAGVADRVTLAGFVSNPYGRMADADLLVSCSNSESFSLVVAEAMVLGVPVLATRTAGPSELIGSGDAPRGMLCGHTDADILEGVLAVMDDYPAARRRADDAHGYALATFSPKTILSRIYSILNL